ncbi:TolC family protein [Sandaracinus amylolyticus]|uniref:TolC family protein n=1 Tax=Sandaracinus amylolyticus TaxID=927083 RepID=UPI001F00479F|nr:TolC family protein [Sandaracinus amylolyticus]UJR82487.1 Hypothetical protein I5071_45520 [Sandaracinus amylolyticus]
MRIASILALLGALVVAPSATSAQAITEREAVSRALDASPRLRAAQADLAGSRASVRAAEGARTPTLALTAQGHHTEGMAAAANGLTRQQQDGISSEATVAMTTDLGTTIELGVATGVAWRSTNLDPSRTTIFRIGPTYSGQVTVGVRQPLLRGAGDDATLGTQRQAEASRTAAERTLDQAISQLALDVVTAHRELWYAEQSLAVSDDALALARRQHEEAELRLRELGTVSRTEVLRYASQVASAERARAMALTTVETRAIELGRLLGMGPAEARVLRADAAALDPVEPSALAILADAARASSSELLALEADIAAARERERTARDADQPRVDLVTQLAAGLLFNDETLGTLQLPGDRPAFSGTLGLEVELPLGSSQAGAEREVASAQHEAALARYEDRAQEIVGRAASLRATLVAAAERIALSVEAERAARELAEAERERLRLGTGTALEVLQAQQSERDATLERLRAQADYAEAEAELAHITGALAGRYAGGVS